MLLLEAGGPDTAPEIRIPCAFPAVFKSGLDWDLLGEQEPGLGQPPALPPARPRDRRLELDQRDDLPARQPRRLRRLGGGRLRRLVVTTRCSRTSSAPRTTSAARTTTTASAGRSAVSDSRSMQPLIETMLEAAVQAGYERNPDLNGEQQEGVGPLPAHAARRHALEHGRRVPAPGGRAAEPRGREQRLRPADRLRGRPRGRRRGRPQRRAPRPCAPSAR